MTIKIAIAQLNLTVGDIESNVDQVIAAYQAAIAKGAELAVTPELAISGYPPEDLLLRPDFLDACGTAVRKAAASTGTVPLLLGAPEQLAPGEGTGSADSERRGLANSAFVCAEGEVLRSVRKQLLPNYGVFDERRWFEPGSPSDVLAVAGHLVGVCVCEDIWDHSANSVASTLVEKGAEALVVLNASPYAMGKQELRIELVSGVAASMGVPVVYVNLVGGQDEVVFDGASFAVDSAGTLVWQAPAFKSAVEVVELPLRGELAPRVEPEDILEEHVWQALCLGTRDYVEKNGIDHVTIGLSGGIDSAVVAAIAVDALGSEKVTGVGLPGPFSAEGSITDAESLAERLGIEFLVLPIGPIYESSLAVLHGEVGFGDREPSRPFAGMGFGAAEENLQARIRAELLMALANKLGGIVLTTGNKSEVAVGYCTLYGDMAGGFAPLKDVPKTLVYRLARWRNSVAAARAGVMPIPAATIEKPPSAELAPGQRDDQSLPPYEVLDEILRLYVDEVTPPSVIAAALQEVTTAEEVARVTKLVDANEHKRRQAAMGVKISARSFGKERRLPVTNGFRAYEEGR